MLLSEHEKTEIGKNILTSASNFYGHFVGKKFSSFQKKKVDRFFTKKYREFFYIFAERNSIIAQIYLSVCLSFFLYNNLSISVLVSPSLCSSICLCLFLFFKPNCMVQFASMKKALNLFKFKPMCLSVHLFICLSFFPSIHPSIYMLICCSVCLYIRLCLFLFMEPNCMVLLASIKLALNLFKFKYLCLSVSLSTSSSVYLSVLPSVHGQT